MHYKVTDEGKRKKYGMINRTLINSKLIWIAQWEVQKKCTQRVHTSIKGTITEDRFVDRQALSKEFDTFTRLASKGPKANHGLSHWSL